MTYRASDSSSRDCYSQSQSRLSRCESTDEGCPVLEESGSVCGETNGLGVFQEFRQMYDDCLKKLEGTEDGSATLKKLTPFKKLIDDLWEQNTMLVETVEELEQEATSKVTNLQDRLNKSSQKLCEYEEDIKSLTELIQRYCERGVFDTSGLKFNTVAPECAFPKCDKNSNKAGLVESKTSPDSEVFNCKSRFFQNDIPVKSKSGTLKKSKAGKNDAYTTNSKSRVPLPSIMESNNMDLPCLPDEYSKAPLHQGICYDINCFCSSIKEEEEEDVMADNACEFKEYQDCKGSININFNLGKESIMSSSDCCCSCSCVFSSNEADDC